MLFENEGDWRFSGSGTCFLVHYGTGNYIVTAKHVINGYSPAQIRVMINPEARTGDVNCFTLGQPFTFNQYGNEDFEDFVIAPVCNIDLNEDQQSLFFQYQHVSDCHFLL